MKAIRKRAEPRSLTVHRASQHADYENYAPKDDLRRSLVAEQGGICCYCMQRIQPTADRMKVEHWQSQEDYPERQLDYRNLLGACPGNEGEPHKRQHCDSFKGKAVLSRNPADPAHRIESLIHYLADGSIQSSDARLNRELDKVLNLNVAPLRNNRKAVLDALKDALQARGPLKPAELRRMIADWSGRSGGGEFRPYCQVIVYWLNKRLARM